MLQHVLTHAVVPQISSESQLLVRLYRVCTLILQMVGPDLVQQTNTPAFLTQIQQNATAFTGNISQRFFQLVATITAHAIQGITRSEERRVGKECKCRRS